MSNKSEEIKAALKMAKALGIGDGTHQTALAEGVVIYTGEAEKAHKIGDLNGAIGFLIIAMKGAASYIISDNRERKGEPLI